MIGTISQKKKIKLTEYTPDPIDEYVVTVNLLEDWSIVHDYIINENEIDNIPNRKIECLNEKSSLSRSSIYSMSVEEANILKNHEKVVGVELNPEKYLQHVTLTVVRYKKNVAFNKPRIAQGLSGTTFGDSTVTTNGVRSNWSHTFSNNPASQPYQGVGIGTTMLVNRDISFSLSGKNVDCVILDSGVAAVHPDFLDGNGKTRVRDIILDAPYEVDSDYFTNIGVTYNKVVDGIDVGVGIATTSAREWWGDASKRSSKFSGISTIVIPTEYTLDQAFSKNASSNPIGSGHGTACASQIGGNTFGLAFDCNIWNVRIATGDGVLSPSVALDACTIFHASKKLNSNDPNPTILNNSWGGGDNCGNTNEQEYDYSYRGSSLTYTGTGSEFTYASNSGPCRTTALITFRHPDDWASITGVPGGGFEYSSYTFGLEIMASINAAAEAAIAEGCIVVAASGNDNMKMCDKNSPDFNNSYSIYYINRVGLITKGFSGDHEVTKGSIRVGSIDVGVEPVSERQGTPKYSIRKVHYSNNGPMIDVFAPGESTMAAGYADYEDIQREDDTNYYDTWFAGTSSACPNVVSLLALYLQSNRKANQDAVRYWLWNSGSVKGLIADPYKTEGSTSSDDLTNSYWGSSYTSIYDYPDEPFDSYNIGGSGNLRESPNRILFNPYANDVIPSIKNVTLKGIHITHK